MFQRREDDVQYLLLQRARGNWVFPGGKIEEGERFIDTARRESKEETGISRVKIFPHFQEIIRFRYNWPPKTKDAETRLKMMVLYLGEVFTKDVSISDEHKEFQWVTYEKAHKLLKHRNVREVLERAHQRVVGGDISAEENKINSHTKKEEGDV